MAVSAAKRTSRQDPASRAFGDRVRLKREQANMTLDQLAKLSGVSRAMISKVERGEKSPTIGVAKHIAHALGANFSALMGDEAATRRAFALVRKEQRQIFRDPKTGFERHLLSPLMPGMPIEVILHRLPPKTATGKMPPHPSGVTKHVAVLRGRIVAVIENAETVLEEGDALYFDADVEHGFENRTARPAEYHLVICGAQTASGQSGL
jgi:transcriptional regulator with XRE-family HTH domain